MKINRITLSLIVVPAALCLGSCRGNNPNDSVGVGEGYTLLGTVTDSITDGVIDSAQVSVGYSDAGTTQYRLYTFTDANGDFLFFGFPNTAPLGGEMFLIEKIGFRAKEVAARSAVREPEVDYHLRARLVPESAGD